MKKFILAIFMFIGILLTAVYLVPLSSLVSAQGSNIVYITSDSTSLNQNSMATYTVRNLGASIVNSVSQIPTSRRLEGIVVDVSAIPSVDRAWLSDQYRRGVTIAFVGTSSAQAAEYLNNYCLTQLGLEASSNSYIIASFYIEGLNPSDVALAQDAYFSSCGETSADGIQQPLLLSFRFSGDVIVNVQDFTNLIHSHINGIRENRQQFRNQRHQ